MKKNNVIIISVVVLALLGFVFYPWVILPLKNISQKMIMPLSSFLTHSTSSCLNFFSKIGSIGNLDKENNQLTQENLELKSKLVQLKELKHENEILRNELNFINDKQLDEYVSAQIISYSPSSYLRSFKLNKGSDDEIKVNQAVISSGFLVGIVTEVFDNNCDVLLITDAISLIPIIIQKSRATGLLQGGLKGLMVREIPLDNEIEEGEMVLTSGLGGTIAGSIPIGKVKKIISAESEIFQKASIESPIKFNNLEIVFIVK